MVGNCAICGRPITHPGPDGECVRCLVSFGFLAEGDPAREQGAGAGVASGPLRYAHFEVEVNSDGYPVVLGAGAMAVTYAARDTILNSPVALKVISRKLAANETARARFLREARAAAQLHHPNVARVIHYGEQDGECFYAMERVEGETLEDQVHRDGPFPLSLALEVVEQATLGLAAGEACGVIHRDLKPSNVMIESDPSGHVLVKIIDYGVAKVMADDGLAVQTQAGFIGTPAFASPEQFAQPGAQQIDTRSDIYSLGATLWYLLTGQTPFTGRSIDEIRAKQNGPLPLEQLKARRVPAKVVALLKSMLAANPAERPQTARELLTGIHRCFIRFEPRARTRRTRLVRAAVVSALLVAAIAFGSWWYRRERSATEIERSIAVLPFENLSPNAEDEFFSAGMQNELTADLAQISGIKVIGAESTRGYLPGKERNLRAIGRELGVRHLVEESVGRANGEIRVDLRLIDLRDPEHPWTQNYQRPVKDVFALKSEITRTIAARLQTHLSRSETAALAVPLTNDLQAYDLYLQAVTLPRLLKDSAEQYRTTQKCISLLEHAVARDPNFVAAYCEIAEAHDVLFRNRQVLPPQDRLVDHRALAEAALATARRVQPDAGRVHLALATHFLSTGNDLEQARMEVELARRSLPNSADLELTAGAIARGQSRWDEAIRCFEKAVALEPRQNVHRFTLANAHRLLRHYGEFDHLIDDVVKMMPARDSATYRVFRCVVAMERDGDVAPLRAVLSTLSTVDDPDSKIRDLHSVILALADHDADAVSRALAPADATAFVFNGVAYPKAWFEGLAARMRGDASGAQAAFQSARTEVEKTVFADPGDARSLSLLAMIDAGLGKKEDAVREARQACDLAGFTTSALNAPIVRCNLAVVYAWTGQADLAIRELEQIVEKPAGSNLPAQPTYGDFRRNPVWDPLRSDAGFERLVQRLAPAGGGKVTKAR